MKQLFRKIFRLVLGLIIFSYASLIIYAYVPTKEIPSKELATTEDRFVEVNGYAIRYRQYLSDRKGSPNLILIHGFGNNLNSWRSITPILSQSYNIYVFDLLGFGLSDKPTDYDYTNTNQARTVGKLANKLNLDSFIVGGHSLGGAIAFHVAMNNKKTQGLILFNPGIINTGVPEFATYLNLVFPFARVSAKQFADREFREAFLKRSYHDPSIVDNKVMDEIMLGTRSEGYLRGTTSMLNKFYDTNEAQLMHKVTLPTLIVFGVEDRNKTIEEALELKNGFVNSKLELIQNAGHYVHEESPKIVSERIIREMTFLTKKS